jgi:hypothetical protein
MSRNHSSNQFAPLLSILVLLLSGCSQRRDDAMIPVGPDQRANLVVFFKSGATNEEVNKFVHETISTPERGGFRLLSGIWQTLNLLPVDGHEGYAITFFPEATKAERDRVKAAVEASPIVYRVFENVAPKEIKNIDAPPDKPAATSNKSINRTRN